MKLFPLAFTLLAAGFLMGTILASPAPEPAGDICEYYGITQTLISHGSFDLKESDVAALEKQLGNPYYNLWYCYRTGKHGERYPIHFFGFSLIATPIRLALETIGIDPLKTLSVTNVLFLAGGLLYILHRFHLTQTRGATLILLTLASPLISFLTWPGPDLAVMMLLLIALLHFLHGKPATALYLAALASWQSQPLLAVVAILSVYLLITKRSFVPILFAGLLSVIPYIYNMYVFGTLTPWTLLIDGWTKLNGFGLHNVSFQKLIEQFVDLNIGVFWYAPVITALGIALLNKQRLLAGILMATLLAFQTNPAWHYGTAGFGPSRHAIVMIPFFIAVITHEIAHSKRWLVALGLVILFQIAVLSVNNYIFPIFTNSLVHTPVARFVLDRWPTLYSPTPEIFVDRTNHTDLDYPTSAVYKTNGVCKKAYVLAHDIDMVVNECGPFPTTPRGSIYNTETDGFYVNYE